MPKKDKAHSDKLLKKNIFEKIKLRKLDEVINTFMYDNPEISITSKIKTLYRGQSQSEWGLIPSVFRRKTNIGSFENWIKDCLQYEFQNFKEFVTISDEMGFQIPGEYYSILNSRFENGRKWSDENLNSHFEQLALRQVSGKMSVCAYNLYLTLVLNMMFCALVSLLSPLHKP